MHSKVNRANFSLKVVQEIFARFIRLITQIYKNGNNCQIWEIFICLYYI